MITREELEADGWTFNGEVWCKKTHNMRFGYLEKTNTLIVGWHSSQKPVTTMSDLQTIVNQYITAKEISHD